MCYLALSEVQSVPTAQVAMFEVDVELAASFLNCAGLRWTPWGW